jgi:hypothetical protein
MCTDPSGPLEYFAYGRMFLGPLNSVRQCVQWMPSTVEVKYGFQHGPRTNRYILPPATTGFG